MSRRRSAADRTGRRRSLGLAGPLAATALLALPGAALASDRALEPVPPVGGPPYSLVPDRVTPDGEHFFWSTAGDPPGVTPDGGSNGTHADLLVSSRGSAGWASTWLTPYPDQTAPVASAGAQLLNGSTSGDRVLFITTDVAVSQDTNGVQDYYVGSRDGVTLVSPGLQTQLPQSTSRVGASDDLSTVVFVTPDALIPADTDALDDVYAYRNGGLTLISAKDDGSDPGTSAAVFGGDQSYGALASQPVDALFDGAVSADGSTIFFVTADQLAADDTDSNADLYASVTSVGGARHVVRLTDGVGDVRFRAGSSDGKYAYFSSRTPQVAGVPADLGDDLYRVRVSDGTIDVVALSASQNDPPFLDRISADGSSAFYATSRVDDPADTDGGDSLYRWRSAGSRYIAPLTSTDRLTRKGAGLVGTNRSAFLPLRSTPDGAVVAFEAAANIGADSDGRSDVFVWDGTGAPTRISQGATGGDGGFDARLGSFSQTLNTFGNGRTAGRAMTGDGSTVFFSTAEPLVAADTNTAVDVYEWSAAAGAELVSSGTASADAVYIDNGIDGRDVLFASNQSLDGSGGVVPLVYDARIGGGFPAPPTAPPAEGGGSGPGILPAGPSLPSTQPPPANTAPPASNAPVDVNVASLDRSLHANDDSVAVGLDVSAPGQLLVALTTPAAGPRAGGGPRPETVLASAAQTVDHAGHVTVTLTLTDEAQRLLARHGRMRVTLRSALQPTGSDGPPVSSATRVTLTSGQVTVLDRSLRLHGRRARIRLAVPAAGRVRILVRPTGKGRTLARGSRDVTRPGRTRVTVRLTRVGRRAARHDRRLHGQLRVTMRPDGAPRLRATARVTLRGGRRS